ncbi:MAG: sigma-70 family RNA polymerase sigma factor [Pirellulales bacterium]|nr:sigma-70 family RNA polymerase sigma factor [Pirellulales bacterium]
MNETSTSLLERLRCGNQPDDWARLQSLYSPLLRAWARRYDVNDSDADDLVQEVLATVANEVAEFDHNGRQGAFRTWLKRILVNRLREFWRSRARSPVAAGGSDIVQRLNQLEEPQSELSQRWDREHDRYVLRCLLETAQLSFAPNTWKAFRQVVVEGRAAAAVAADLGISLNAVFIAKSRVIRRLREEAEGLVQSSSSFFPKC